ncbi:hypothetical protein BGZ61DRAFT_368673 [Ilyonectria robusta]|uniref:uncharacterized protein n=1 Tax=Ilyonectria robusta TaxID=1079257 RepID=UPI001E8EE22C|nr:uncharacterized protein BGZ61DRAFT_368673 [Ilyonectria robusta]KAH8661706.1 hypothetical protein BGZ61DRAFT_368673 [Ilyonectria robusta]
MKISVAIVAALAFFAAASPGKPKGCTPGTYACTKDASSWQVCDVSRKFVFAGTCPPKTVCKFFQPSLSPYCVPSDFEFP